MKKILFILFSLVVSLQSYSQYYSHNYRLHRNVVPESCVVEGNYETTYYRHYNYDGTSTLVKKVRYIGNGYNLYDTSCQTIHKQTTQQPVVIQQSAAAEAVTAAVAVGTAIHWLTHHHKHHHRPVHKPYRRPFGRR